MGKESLTINPDFYDKILSYLEENWYKVRGLFATLVVTEIIWIWILSRLPEYLPYIENIYFFSITSASIAVLTFCIWLFSRRLPYFADDEFGILFALPFRSKKTSEELEKLYLQTRARVSGSRLDKKIVVKKLPPNHIPIYDKDAHKIRDLTGAKLIIWGDIINGYYSGEEAIFIAPIKISYHIQLPQEHTGEINEDFSALLREKKWIIRRDNDILDVAYVAANIGIVSLYIIGLILHFGRQEREAVNILGEAFFELAEKKKNQGFTKNERVAYEKIKYVVMLNYDGLIRKLDISFRDKDNIKKIRDGHELIKEIRKVEANDAGAYLFEGTLRFLEEDLDGAEDSILKASKFIQTYKDAAPSYSLAFLNFYRGNLEYGWNHLEAALRPDRIIDRSVNIEIIKFYEDVLEKEPEKKQLYFPLAVIYYEDMGDTILAKECFGKFVEAYENISNDKGVTLLLSRAKEYIKKCS